MVSPYQVGFLTLMTNVFWTCYHYSTRYALQPMSGVSYGFDLWVYLNLFLHQQYTNNFFFPSLSLPLLDIYSLTPSLFLCVCVLLGYLFTLFYIVL